MPYANIDGVNLYYEDHGTGPAVLLTPGGRVDHNGLRPMAPLLSRPTAGSSSTTGATAASRTW